MKKTKEYFVKLNVDELHTICKDYSSKMASTWIDDFSKSRFDYFYNALKKANNEERKQRG